MQANLSIVLLDDKLRAMAFISLFPELSLETTEYLNEDDKKRLQRFIESLESRNPKIKREVFGEALQIDLVEIPKTDAKYLAGIEEELAIMDFRAKVIPSALMPSLRLASMVLSFKQRQILMPELLSAPYDIESGAIFDLESILFEYAKI